MSSFIPYSQDWAPTWLTKPFGRKFMGAIGNECDAFVARDQLGVNARYPTGSPNDALSSIGQTRNLLPSANDDTNGTKYRAWLRSAFTKDALDSPTPVDPDRPGWYYGGTQGGIIAALVNSGFLATAADGTLVKPRIYTNRQFVAYTPITPGTTPGTVTCSSTLPHDPDTAPTGRRWLPDTSIHAVACTITGSGTAGASGSVDISIDGNTPVSHSPIPLKVIQAQGSASFQITFAGAFLVNDLYEPSSPTHQTGKWTNLWLAVPHGTLFEQAPLWGTPDWDWGEPPPGTTQPAFWGAIDPIVGRSLYGLLYALMQSWKSGGARFVGAWICDENTQIDSPPATTWLEETDVTFGGKHLPFWRYLLT